MSRHLYEGMFLLDANRYSSDTQGVTSRITSMLENHGAELLASRPWDERRLAYPVGGQRKGVYLLTYFRIDGPEVSKIEYECRLNEAVLRQLILKVDRQLEEDVLAQVDVASSEQSSEAGDQEAAPEEKTNAPEEATAKAE